jgi:hypothetical protein
MLNPTFYAEKLVDISNDTNFEKLASFVAEGKLSAEEMGTDISSLIEKQAYAEDSSFADDLNRMFSVASPIETKLSALYATKCASLLSEDVVNRINNACHVYEIDTEVPVVNKVASVLDDPKILQEIQLFDAQYQDPEEVMEFNKYAGATSYGTELDKCLAARAFYAEEPEDVEAIEGLAKLASSIAPDDMVTILEAVDSHLGLDTPAMQNRVGSPEYAVYEKVASENMVNLNGKMVPFDVVASFQDDIADLGVDLDWDGESADALTLQLENLPSQIKDEIGSWCK